MGVLLARAAVIRRASDGAGQRGACTRGGEIRRGLAGGQFDQARLHYRRPVGPLLGEMPACRARASALARTTSGSRRSVGKISGQGRSRRILGLLMRMRFTVISSPVAVSGDLLTTTGPDFFGTGSAWDVMRQRHVGRHSKVDLTGGIFSGWAPGTKVPPGIGTARW